MTYPTVNYPGMITVIYSGKKYDVLVSWDGKNGVFIVHNKDIKRNVVVVDGLSEYEVRKLYTLLSNVKDIDDWVNTTFEMDKPINGKHVQEYFENRLNKVIYNE